MLFSGDRLASFMFNTFFSISFLPPGNWWNLLFWGLEVYPHNGPHWHHRFPKKIQMPILVPLKFCNCTLWHSLLSEGLQLGLLFSALKQQKVANFPRAEPKPLEMETFILNPQNAVGPPEKTFSFTVICEFLSFLSILNNSMAKGMWNDLYFLTVSISQKWFFLNDVRTPFLRTLNS